VSLFYWFSAQAISRSPAAGLAAILDGQTGQEHTSITPNTTAMASIPLASTSRAVFVPSSSSRLLRRSLFQASSATASTSSISHRSQPHQQQQCRHASSAPTGATSKHMHDDGMQNIPPQSFFHQHGSVGGSGHQIPLPPAIASKKEAGTSELKWMAKQMDLLERRDNKKTDIPVKVRFPAFA
jgi:hypothetical protein